MSEEIFLLDPSLLGIFSQGTLPEDAEPVDESVESEE